MSLIHVCLRRPFRTVERWVCVYTRGQVCTPWGEADDRNEWVSGGVETCDQCHPVRSEWRPSTQRLCAIRSCTCKHNADCNSSDVINQNVVKRHPAVGTSQCLPTTAVWNNLSLHPSISPSRLPFLPRPSVSPCLPPLFARAVCLLCSLRDKTLNCKQYFISCH